MWCGVSGVSVAPARPRSIAFPHSTPSPSSSTPPAGDTLDQVLRRLGYTSAEGVLGTKGRFSCELSTPDELVLTDMVRVAVCAVDVLVEG